MSQKVLLWNGYHNIFVALHHALAAQAGVDARVHGTVNVVFFFVGDLGEVVHASLYVYMAGAAPAHAAAVVLQLYVVIERHVQHRFSLHSGKGLVGRAVSEFKSYIYDFHASVYLRCKVMKPVPRFKANRSIPSVGNKQVEGLIPYARGLGSSDCCDWMLSVSNRYSCW